MSLLNNLINGISLGSVYAIIALGYTMVYGIAKMLNFAHGDIIMVGAYVCFFATGQFGLSPIAGCGSPTPRSLPPWSPAALSPWGASTLPMCPL